MSQLLQDTFSCAGRSAFITGASSGFGAHFARVLAAAGCTTVALAARRLDRLEGLALQLRQEFPDVLCIPVACDVANVDSIVSAFDRAEQANGGKAFDIIVNNAGVGPAGFAIESSEKTFDQVVNINQKGAWFVAQEAASRLVKRKQPGSIVNISSILGLRVSVKNGLYSMSKAAMNQMTKAMALELIRDDIRVNCICPGYYRTEMTEEFFDSEAGKKYISTKIPSRRVGEINQLDGALLLLASSAGSNMTGTIIPVDGGHVISSL